MPGSAQRLSAWLRLARLPFHSVGVLPFVLGMVLAYRLSGNFRWPTAAFGTLGVILVMLATYFAGEHWDYAEDTLSGSLGRSRFAGGSGVLQSGLLPRHAALRAALVSVALALVVALALRYILGTGPWTVPFALIGLLGGFFYSARPVRWVSTGIGELWIAFCYGWLPVAVGCYLQTASVPRLVHVVALPIAFTIFNVILLNEFPDYDADRQAGKANLTVRLGRERAAWLYAAAAAAACGAFLLSLRYGVPGAALWAYLPVLALTATLAVLVVGGRWRERPTLERLCGANLLVNLGTTAAYILAFAR